MRRLVSGIAATMLMVVATVMTVTAPAAAAGPTGIYHYYGYCLDQHYHNNIPTTTVYVWPDCHLQDNQIWTFEYVGGTDNYYRIKNKQANYTWCLSQPPEYGDRIYAEICRWDQKQYWKPEFVNGNNRLRNWRSQQCMTMERNIEVWAAPCSNLPIQMWFWF